MVVDGNAWGVEPSPVSGSREGSERGLALPGAVGLGFKPVLVQSPQVSSSSESAACAGTIGTAIGTVTMSGELVVCSVLVRNLFQALDLLCSDIAPIGFADAVAWISLDSFDSFATILVMLGLHDSLRSVFRSGTGSDAADDWASDVTGIGCDSKYLSSGIASPMFGRSDWGAAQGQWGS